MANDVTGNDLLGATQQELEQILNGDYKNAFRAQDYFLTDNSTGHVFDVIKGHGIMRSNVDGDALVKMIKVSSPTIPEVNPRVSRGFSRF